METYVYQLHNKTWTSEMAYKNLEMAKRICEMMNEDRAKLGQKPDIKVRTVLLVNEPF